MPAPVPTEHVTVPAPVSGRVASSGGVLVATAPGGGNGHNGHTNGNGHKVEPAWLQKLKTREFDGD